jgi:hypothetical protein
MFSADTISQKPERLFSNFKSRPVFLVTFYLSDDKLSGSSQERFYTAVNNDSQG